MLRIIILAVAVVCAQQVSGLEAKRSFTVDYDHATFLKDGKPFHYIAGIMHYFRVPHYYWNDRLYKMAAAGLDAVQTYVAWNLHEPMPGVYDFQGQQNITAFLSAAQDNGLTVILRVGPFICAEWDYGGFPAWLLSDNETMVVRTMDKKYIAAVDRWLGVLLPIVKPFLYSNGGPIIMVQVENEYGSYSESCTDQGRQYMRYLRETFKHHLGHEVVLFTSDGSNSGFLQCGPVEGVLPTVNFGPGWYKSAAEAFHDLRSLYPNIPLVDSELYTAWFDQWNGQHQTGDIESLVSTIEYIYKAKASSTMYMFEGGTNFGYMNGVSGAKILTSYDYDGPLSESGDVTEKYLAIRNFTSQFKKLPDVPENRPKYEHGPVVMEKVGSVLDLMNVVGSSPLRSLYPLNMEQANHFYGFVLYRHVLTKSYSSELIAEKINDRGYLLLDGVPKGLIINGTVTMSAEQGQVIDIIVENQGRQNYGDGLNDNKKGLLSNVTFDGEILSNWEMHPLNFTKVFNFLDQHQHRTLRKERLMRKFVRKQLENEPTVYKGEFVLRSKEPLDTFLKMCGWSKGQAFINGFNLGRYWPTQGPQVTLYVPAGVLNPAPLKNTLVMLELEHSPSSSGINTLDFVQLVKEPILNSKCSQPFKTESMEPAEIPTRRRHH